MERRAAAILLMLSLVAILLVGAAVADDTLRLPSDLVMGEKARPWDCCDNLICSTHMCACKDFVEKCATDCTTCKVMDESIPAGRMCRDMYSGDDRKKAPHCTKT